MEKAHEDQSSAEFHAWSAETTIARELGVEINRDRFMMLLATIKMHAKLSDRQHEENLANQRRRLCAQEDAVRGELQRVREAAIDELAKYTDASSNKTDWCPICKQGWDVAEQLKNTHSKRLQALDALGRIKALCDNPHWTPDRKERIAVLAFSAQDLLK